MTESYRDLLDVPDWQDSTMPRAWRPPPNSDRLAGLCLAAISGAIMGGIVVGLVMAMV